MLRLHGKAIRIQYGICRSSMELPLEERCTERIGLTYPSLLIPVTPPQVPQVDIGPIQQYQTPDRLPLPYLDVGLRLSSVIL
ncbi:hypothetical protein M422DRAFT_36380 [Sphaerobolus stellatus SS14]|uniref:Uncharacterized protein n=1 Tax=Sphaerobolus stellatus (strain SS14) TaxID=990650 RepID=A0A0C9TLY3_SPHS4|nr:hypothetical protein M422DRAFT_36380 [Sphaerobolus stellatus SS14]